jgi:Tfp pilus assembly protein PilW
MACRAGQMALLLPGTIGPELRRRTGRPADQAGITLVELLMACVIFGIVTAMIIGGWIVVQRSTVFAVQDNDASAEGRDALSRISVELRDAQPPTLPTTQSWALLTAAGPWAVEFYSAYNVPGAKSDGSGTNALRKTRIFLDSSGSSDQKTVKWQRDVDGDGTYDRTMVLAKNVVNTTTANTSTAPTTSYTPLFTYGYRNVSGSYMTTDNSDLSLDLTSIIAVQIRLITDIRPGHAPKYIDLSTTIRPRNAAKS